MEWLFLLVVTALAFANGANDNFKGVATLWGSDTLAYRPALWLANGATLAGALMATYLGYRLLAVFSGKGIVSPHILQNPDFGLAFGAGAALTVLLATALRLPISTTHALMGALAGASFWHMGWGTNFSILGSKALIPLIASPLIAVGATWTLWRAKQAAQSPWMRQWLRRAMAGSSWSNLTPRPAFALAAARTNPGACPSQLPKNILHDTRGAMPIPKSTMAPAAMIDCMHVMSGALVCFARGVNDTPKIASVLILAQSFSANVFWAMAAVAFAMVLGGHLMARPVATTMSKELTGVTHAQGLTGNIATATLVLSASIFGLPVSTTHVSVGALIGIGVISGGAKWRRIGEVAAAWVVTLPIAFVLSLVVAQTLQAW